MTWILILAIVVIILILLRHKFPKNRADGHADHPYQKTDALFTPAERSFYGVLKQVAGDNATIFGKVRVADVVVPNKGLSRSHWQKSFNKISGKHFDFLLCRNDTLSVICAIELNDSSHKSNNRHGRDEFLKGVCNAAEIPLIQVPAKAAYVIDEVKAIIAPYLSRKELSISGEDRTSPELIASEKLCPKCSSPLIMRIAKKGPSTGKRFLACSSFPKCKHIEPMNA
jgi:hypothetical protein